MGPLLELIGYASVTAAALFGLVDWRSWFVLMAVAVLCGTAVTLVAVLMSDFLTRKYMRRGDLALLVAVVFLENCGYRQLNSWWGLKGTFQALTGKGGWGVVKRKAFEARRLQQTVARGGRRVCPEGDSQLLKSTNAELQRSSSPSQGNAYSNGPTAVY
jgi:hypothetical protein